MPETPLKSKLHALLIGVDCYLPNRLPGGGSYPSLGGCVRDVKHVETFLRTRLGLTDADITTLTASNRPGSREPAEPKEQWPTYENMVRAFQELTERAQPGEQVYVHYSGHGGRSRTAYPDLKGESGLDESLVPTDIGTSEARYLRDLEVAFLIRQMTQKGLVVTLVFDDCHSGGATRGGDAGSAVRGIPTVDNADRPTDSLVATPAQLKELWQAAAAQAPAGAQQRSAQLSSGWLPELEGAVLLAACRANELANEFAFEGTERNGALTYWLLDTLKQLGPGLTYEMVHDRLLAKVHAKFPQQTPQLYGEGARVVFGTTSAPRPPSVRVVEVDRGRNRVRVEAGKAQGLVGGARFAVYAADADFADPAQRLALVEVAEPGDTDSWAVAVEGTKVEAVSEGAAAVVLDAGVRFRGRVRLVEREDLPDDIDQAAALARARSEIKGQKWITLAEDEGEAADLQVAVNFNHEYEVWEPTGRIIDNLRPALRIDDDGAAAKLAGRLVHLTKFQHVKLIENASHSSPLAHALALRWEVRKPDGQFEAAPKGPGGEFVVDHGDKLFLTVENKSSQPLNVSVLDLQPDWGVSKLFPRDTAFELLDPKTERRLPGLIFELPDGYKEGLDTIKVFATVGNTSFDWLTLPALDKPQTRGNTRSPLGGLEELMAEFTSDAPPESRTRARFDDAEVSTWTTAQTDIHIRRRPRAIKHVRELSVSLLQAAFEEVAEKHQQATRGPGAPAAAGATRGSVTEPDIEIVTAFLASDEDELPDAATRQRDGATRGAVDTVRHCGGLLKKMASELWNAKVRGDDAEYIAAQKGLTEKFGSCDPRYVETFEQYARFIANRGKIPYREWKQLSDFVIDDRLPSDARIGLVADWATGQEEALEVLRQIKRHDPHVVAHLGDIYYAGTAEEVENYFHKPWKEILDYEAAGITSIALPGNHDLYAGGQPYYDLLDKLKQPASYVCLRNEHWQLIGLDTALNDKTFNPEGTPTTLAPSEVEWLRDKLENSGGRRTALMSHHQLFSTNDQWGKDKRSFNPLLNDQLAGLLDKVDIWFWGHEHDLVIFDRHMGLERGRCIGGSAYPVSKFEMPASPRNADVPYNRQVVLGKGSAFYQHCYAVMRLDGRSATVDYYEDSDGGRRLFSETF